MVRDIPKGVVVARPVAKIVGQAINGKMSLSSIGYCESCGCANPFYTERCLRCRGPKPWLYMDELVTSAIPAGIEIEIDGIVPVDNSVSVI